MRKTATGTAKVLIIVEDEPDVRAMIRAILSLDGRLEIHGEAASAQEAIELARTSHPGLIILDHSIEGDVMGLAAAPLLKQVAPNAKIILFTAFDLAAEAAVEPAIDVFLPKTRVADLRATALELLGL